jgi:hypothetical protein
LLRLLDHRDGLRGGSPTARRKSLMTLTRDACDHSIPDPSPSQPLRDRFEKFAAIGRRQRLGSMPVTVLTPSIVIHVHLAAPPRLFG